MITTEEIYNEVVQIFEDYDDKGRTIHVSSIDDNLYTDLGMDSLNVVEIVMLCEGRFNIHFEDEEIVFLHTVDDIVKIIYKNVNK